MNRKNKIKITIIAAAAFLTVQGSCVYASSNIDITEIVNEAEDKTGMESSEECTESLPDEEQEIIPEENTEEATEEVTTKGQYADSYIIASENVMVCTNTLGGRKFGEPGDTTMAINLNEDITGTSGIKGSDIISYGFQFVGNPYVYAGSSLTEGCDCSGYVMAVLAHFGITVPHPSASLISCGGLEVSMEDARLGDVIIYNGGSHAAFYMGNGLILEAEDSANGIVAGKRKAFVDEWTGCEKNYVIRRFF